MFLQLSGDMMDVTMLCPQCIQYYVLIMLNVHRDHPAAHQRIIEPLILKFYFNIQKSFLEVEENSMLSVCQDIAI